MAGTSRTATGGHAIGIDLSTTYCCVGYWRDNRVEIIPNDQGKQTTRSYVAFNDEERLIGEAAYNRAAWDPANTVFDAKRLIGKRFSDESVQSDMKLWPFKVSGTDDDKPMISVTYQGKEHLYAAEDISRMILKWLKQKAEDFIGSEVNDAVITVPAYFDHWQRKATKLAGKKAGFKVLNIIDEPVAAAIAYSFLDSGFNVKGKRRNVLIFDLGGGTFDVAVLSVEDGSITVKAKWGDTHLGGEDFDNRLVNHFISEFKKKHKKDISGNPRAIRKLKSHCQVAKESLNSTAEAIIYIDSLFEGIDYFARLARSKFEELNMDLFKKCIEGVEKCLDKAEMDKKHVDDVVLVGGSSRILKVQEMLRDFFEGKRLYKSINADEAVAYGAAIKAAKLAGQGSLKIENLVLVDVAPLSIGVGVVGNVMDVLIPKNTTIPARVVKSFTTVYDYQTRIVFPVFEGERAKSTENKQIGEVELHGIQYARMGEPWIDVYFDLQADGILSVYVRDRITGGESRAAIQRAKLSVNEVERVMGDADQHMAEDEMHRKKNEARTRFLSYVTHERNKMYNEMRNRGWAATQMAGIAIQNAILWLNTKTELAEVSEYEEKMQELKRNSIYWN